MSDIFKTLGIVLAGVIVILMYVAPSVFGALLGKASPLNFAIYLGDAMSFIILSLIVYMSTGRDGKIE